MKQEAQLSFRTDFTEVNLLRVKKKYCIVYENNKVYFYIPTVADLMDEINDYYIVLALLNADPSEFKQSEMGFTANNTFELFSGILLINHPYYKEVITRFFNTFIDNFSTNKNTMLINEKPINEKLFDLIKTMFLIGTGKVAFTALADLGKKEKEMDDLSKQYLQKMKKAQEKVKQIKQAGKKDKEVDLKLVMLSICSELPSYSFDDLFELNYFTLFWIHTNIPKLLDNKIQTIAAGNGLTKDYKYFA